MTKFIAQEDEMSFDFSAYGGPVGVIPEPTSTQIEVFLETLRQTMPTTEDEEGHVTLDIQAISALEEGTDLEALLYGAVASVCSDHPTAAQIKALPFRPQRRFVGWLLGTLLNPEA